MQLIACHLLVPPCFFLHNLGKNSDLHLALAQEGMMEMVCKVAMLEEEARGLVLGPDVKKEENFEEPPMSPITCGPTELEDCSVEDIPRQKRSQKLSQDTIYDIIMALQLVSKTPQCREILVSKNVVRVMNTFLLGLNELARYEMACALDNLSSSKECRLKLIDQGAVDLLVTLSDSDYTETQVQCSSALGHLSEFTKVKNGTVASLLLLSLKAEELKDAQAATSGRRGSVVNSNQNDTIISASNSVISSSAPAKELMAMQNVKSLKVMLKDGLARKKSFHHVNDDISSHTESFSASTFRGVSLQDFSVTGCPPLTEDAKQVLVRDYSSYEYQITSHSASQEGGGMAKKLRVDLPLPTIVINEIEREDRSMYLKEVHILHDPLPKNTSETKIKELIRYASSAIDSSNDEMLEDIANATGRSWGSVKGLRENAGQNVNANKERKMRKK